MVPFQKRFFFILKWCFHINFAKYFTKTFKGTCTTKNSVISPNFLVWKFCWKAVSPQFRAIRPKLCRNCAFPQNFHTRKLGGITEFFAGDCNFPSHNLGRNKEVITIYSYLFSNALKHSHQRLSLCPEVFCTNHCFLNFDFNSNFVQTVSQKYSVETRFSSICESCSQLDV